MSDFKDGDRVAVNVAGHYGGTTFPPAYDRIMRGTVEAVIPTAHYGGLLRVRLDVDLPPGYKSMDGYFIAVDSLTIKLSILDLMAEACDE